MKRRNKADIPWMDQPLRIARIMHGCVLCNAEILVGEPYYDARHTRKAHRICGRLTILRKERGE